jgi:D-alanine--poly(phosphoribitol) ligase subunit 2
MPDPAKLQRQIAHLFLKEMNLEVPFPDTDLFKEGILDSMAFVGLLFQLERQFGVQVSFDDLELDHFRSIEKIAEFVAAHHRGKEPVQGVATTEHEGAL